MKYIGAVMIIMCSFFIGLTLSERLNERLKLLKSFKQLLQQFKISIDYRIPSLYDLFSSASDQMIIGFTQRVASMLNQGISPEICIKEAIEKDSCGKLLSSEEKYFIIGILSEIGSSDIEGQISLLENAIEHIDYYIENAIENKRKNTKVYMTSSLYLGLVIAILLI